VVASFEKPSLSARKLKGALNMVAAMAPAFLGIVPISLLAI
jgi:hypothetical protein